MRQLGQEAFRMASMEGLDAHAPSIEIRLSELEQREEAARPAPR
jgi:histidinol dehydrogenase